MKRNNTKWTQKKQTSKNANVTTTTKNKTATKINNFFKNEKYAKELTFGAQVGVKAPSSDLHMARVGEVPY